MQSRFLKEKPLDSKEQPPDESTDRLFLVADDLGVTPEPLFLHARPLGQTKTSPCEAAETLDRTKNRLCMTKMMLAVKGAHTEWTATRLLVSAEHLGETSEPLPLDDAHRARRPIDTFGSCRAGGRNQKAAKTTRRAARSRRKVDSVGACRPDRGSRVGPTPSAARSRDDDDGADRAVARWLNSARPGAASKAHYIHRPVAVVDVAVLAVAELPGDVVAPTLRRRRWVRLLALNCQPRRNATPRGGSGHSVARKGIPRRLRAEILRALIAAPVHERARGRRNAPVHRLEFRRRRPGAEVVAGKHIVAHLNVHGGHARIFGQPNLGRRI
jgi:hypothetical protein